MCYGSGAGWQGGGVGCRAGGSRGQAADEGCKGQARSSFAQTQTLMDAADDMKERYLEHCVSDSEAQWTRARSMIPPEYDDGEGGCPGVVLLHKRRTSSQANPSLLDAVLQLLPEHLTANREQHEATGMGWPSGCEVGNEFKSSVSCLFQDMYDAQELQIDCYRSACLASGDKVVCDGESHQAKDDRWVYISFPAGIECSQANIPSVKCVGMVKALVRVTVAGADCTIHPAKLARHGLPAPRHNGVRVRSQPLRLALADHWRAVACGGGSGYNVTEDPVTGELRDLLQVSDISAGTMLSWTVSNLSHENLRASIRYYGEGLFDVASFPTQLVATRKIDAGTSRRGLRQGRYYIRPHKASGRQS